MLVRGVIDDQLGHDPDVATMRLVEKSLEILDRPELRIDRLVLRDVVAVVPERRGVERQQPQTVDAERFDVVELVQQTDEIAEAIAIAVAKGFDVELIDNCILIPETISQQFTPCF